MAPPGPRLTHDTMASSATTAVLSRMRNLRVVYVTAPSKDAALKIARAAVERKLAACVNIIPGVTYEWQGKLHEDSEAVLIMKTQEGLLEDLHKVVIENHSYEVPAFVSLPIDGVSQPYADWLLGQTKQSSAKYSNFWTILFFEYWLEDHC
ncbi:divalent-cation tolerance protein CutA family protein [Ancylostoma duodenale]|uniref:Divalent-cation tolerance protein CutA family protein n=1 Tax=Ancylostoma duodenale TaxID=51022 RepID=A0A0C2FM59_9BILA|nr:divalent-cation tolerance protein CutA family protein [Ancylostoma duodenale]